MLIDLANQLSQSSLTGWIQATYWLWPVLEILHFVGLSLLFGGLLVVDLRMLGWFRGIDQDQTHRLLVLVILGFVINLVTGLLFFFGDPTRYAVNIAFQIKMGLVLLAGVNAALFHFRVLPMTRSVSAASASRWPQVCALVSLASWTGVLLFGRLIPYLGTG